MCRFGETTYCIELSETLAMFEREVLRDIFGPMYNIDPENVRKKKRRRDLNKPYIKPCISISPTIPLYSCFRNLNLSTESISSFPLPRFGHSLLPSRPFKLSLNNSPFVLSATTPRSATYLTSFSTVPKLSPKRAHLNSKLKTHFLLPTTTSRSIRFILL